MTKLSSVAVPRRRFYFLDALRGVAALGVVLYHIPSRIDNAPSLVEHGYLAVDFFFILSGFVLAHSYEKRSAAIDFREFLILRAERLLPLSVLGVLFGTIYLLLRWQVQPSLSDGLLGILVAATLNMMLLPKLWIGRATADTLFPANGALWSLSLEMLANLAWARFLLNSENKIIMAVMGVGLGLMIHGAAQAGDVSMGWATNNYAGGLGRVCFGFFAGVLLWRVSTDLTPKPWFGVTAVVSLIAILCLPRCPWWVEMIVITVAMPVIVYLGARAETQGNDVAKALGDLSFPIYAVHYPVVMAFTGSLKFFSATPSWSMYAVMIPIVSLAYATHVFYDLPIRRHLAARRRRRYAG